MDLVTVEGWGKGKFAKGVDVRRQKLARGEVEGKVISSAPTPTLLCSNPLPVKHLITIQDGGIKNLVYQAFLFKITPAVQTKKSMVKNVNLINH